MKIIYTKKGEEILVDDCDFEELNRFRWSLDKDGYAIRDIKLERGKYKRTTMHRFIMNTPTGHDTDHINHNRIDNRKENLRVCTRSENLQNMSIKKSNTSGTTGVYWDIKNNKWRAQIQLLGKLKTFGRYKNLDDAIKARKDAEEKYFGEFAYKANV